MLNKLVVSRFTRILAGAKALSWYFCFSGLGAMFGENGLKEGMNTSSELKVVEVVLGKDFENAM